MPRVIFVDSNERRQEVQADAGTSVLDAAQANGIDIEGACEGQMACSTCHVIVDADWAAKLDAATEEEEFMLDLAFGLTRTSRLGCQIELSDVLDGLVVRLPAEWRNMML
jgi:2Fe-2S ferredoxin